MSIPKNHQRKGRRVASCLIFPKSLEYCEQILIEEQKYIYIKRSLKSYVLCNFSQVPAYFAQFSIKEQKRSPSVINSEKRQKIIGNSNLLVFVNRDSWLNS